MKNSWLIWLFIVGVVVTVLVAFNYQGGKDAVPLSEIFPDSETYPVDIEYEFVDSDQQAQPASEVKETAKAVEEATVPVATEVTPETTTTVAEAPTSTKTEESSATTQKKTTESTYSIQVASFKDKERADKALQELLKKEYAAFIVSKNLGEKGTWYRVYVGNFEAKNQAEAFLSDFKKEYKDSFIISSKKSS